MHCIEEWSGSLRIRKWVDGKEGDCIPGHGHKHNHTTFVMSGICRIEATLLDGSKFDETFIAPTHAPILAGVRHKLTAMVDGTEWWCVFSHRDFNGQVIEDSIGNEEAYV